MRLLLLQKYLSLWKACIHIKRRKDVAIGCQHLTHIQSVMAVGKIVKHLKSVWKHLKSVYLQKKAPNAQTSLILADIAAPDSEELEDPESGETDSSILDLNPDEQQTHTRSTFLGGITAPVVVSPLQLAIITRDQTFTLPPISIPRALVFPACSTLTPAL